MTEQFMENISNEEHERLLLLCGHGIGPALSPAAQAVLTAAEDAYGYNYSEFHCCANSVAAAALRAVVHGDFITSEAILAIATELEGAQ